MDRFKMFSKDRVTAFVDKWNMGMMDNFTGFAFGRMKMLSTEMWETGQNKARYGVAEFVFRHDKY